VLYHLGKHFSCQDVEKRMELDKPPELRRKSELKPGYKKGRGNYYFIAATTT